MQMKNPTHPGDIIRDCLDELGVNVTDGAKALGVTRSALSRLINRRRACRLKGQYGWKRRLAARRAFGSVCSLTMTWRGYNSEAGEFMPAAWVVRRSLRYDPLSGTHPGFVLSRRLRKRAVLQQVK